MRVAYVSFQAVEEGQDSWAAVTEITQNWRKSGWEVDVWAPHYPPGKRPGRLRRAWEMHRLQKSLTPKLGGYDLIYLRGHMMALEISRSAARLGLPVFQECNGTYEDLFVAWPEAKLLRPLFEWMQRWQYQHATGIFCGTESQRDWLRREAPGVPVFVSPNGANDILFSPEATTSLDLPERFALFFGQFAPWQGIEVLLEARRKPMWPDDLPLLFVGDGKLAPIVERAAKEAPEQIRYLGRLPYNELPGVIAAASVTFSPQFTSERGEQGFSALKLYESIACGTPVIGSDYPGVGDVISRHECGVAVRPGDPLELAKAVALLDGDPLKGKREGENGRRIVEQEASWRMRALQRKEIIEDLTRPS